MSAFDPKRTCRAQRAAAPARVLDHRGVRLQRDVDAVTGFLARELARHEHT
jgi:hypothetical protein